MNKQLTKDAVLAAIMQWPSRYQAADGTVFLGMPVSEVAKQLRDCGWRNVSHLRASDFSEMGLAVFHARYVNGARPGRLCPVVFAAPINGEFQS